MEVVTGVACSDLYNKDDVMDSTTYDILASMQRGRIEDFEGIIASGEALYRTFTSIRCPYFSDDVHFNTYGWEHLMFKQRGKARARQDKMMRLRLLHLVPEVLKLSRTVQGVWETRQFERVRMHSRTDTILKTVTYYEFIAVLHQVRIKVIVKQVDSGQKYFWSIIPLWRATKQRGKNKAIRKVHNGNPTED
jgi:hypothetical protein